MRSDGTATGTKMFTHKDFGQYASYQVEILGKICFESKSSGQGQATNSV